MDKFCNYSRKIKQKGLKYSQITYISYGSKSEIINVENDTDISRQSVYMYEKQMTPLYIFYKEKKLMKEIKKLNILPSGYYHYDEVRQDRAFSPIKSVKYPNFGNFNPCCLGFPPSKFLIW